MILWRSRHEAEEAAQTIDEIPEARAWFRHIAESRGIRHAAVADERLFSLRLDGPPLRHSSPRVPDSAGIGGQRQLSATSAYAGVHENFPANRQFLALI